MKWNLSTFGQQLGSDNGIDSLMQDLGVAMSGTQSYRMLGGGNPAHIPEVEAVWRERWEAIQASPGEVERILGNYDTPQGSPVFLDAMADSLASRYGWPISRENIAVVNGSQSAFFYLLNMFKGRNGTQSSRVLLPLNPEYIGYADQLLAPHAFTSTAPVVELIGDHRFKYHIDFDQLEITPETAAICVSRPTNPTGNVLTDEEMRRLDQLAGEYEIPLIVDNAYGAPFPDIMFSETKPVWTENTILAMSLSKLGLPGTRTGIVVASAEVIRRIGSINAVCGLANGNIGQAIAAPLLSNGVLYELSREVIRPYYEAKSKQALAWLDQYLPADIPYRIHVSEGALFLWLWLPSLPISSSELYVRLKQRGVLVVSGHYFFYGLPEPHEHQDRCLRLSYALNAEDVEAGIAILADEVSAIHQ